MKTLIFNGSPRKDGNSSFCSNYIAKNIKGEIKIIQAYTENISACTDCRFCFQTKKCKINDNMQTLYKEIINADNIIIISPLYFSTLTGELLSLFSRTQLFYNAKINLKEKRGAVVLLGGGTSKNIEPAYTTGRIVLRQLNCKTIEYASYVNTDNIFVSKSKIFLNDLQHLCKLFN